MLFEAIPLQTRSTTEKMADMNFLNNLFLSSALLTLTAVPGNAQKLKKADKVIIDQLSQHVSHLSDGPVEAVGREKLAIDYVCSQFTKSGLEPKGDNGTYVHSFDIPLGWHPAPTNYLLINKEDVPPNGYFPLLNSPHISLEAFPSLGLQEANEPWFLDLKEVLSENSVSVKTYIADKAIDAQKKGAKMLFVYNTSDIKDGLEFDGNEKCDPMPLPIIYVRHPIAKKYFSDETASLEIKMQVELIEKKRQGRYVIGMINNNSPQTIMIAADDQLANNTAALLEVAGLLKNKRSKNNNYLLVAFFEKTPASLNNSMSPEKANYIINMQGSDDRDKLNYLYTLIEKAK